MTLYRKKPVEVEAVQFDPEHNNTITAIEFVISNHGSRNSKIGSDQHGRFILIKTPEGTMRANAGDWIIKGVAGEIYPCKDEIFQQTYEEVT